MGFYLDTSFLVSLFIHDAHSQVAGRWIRASDGDIAVSAWAEAEFAAVIRRKARNLEIPAGDVRLIQADFDAWKSEAAKHLDVVPAAAERAALLARDDREKLSAPDALHLALSMLNRLMLVTFDDRLAATASALASPVAVPGASGPP
jgi:uncharacterized protein